jgi:hypothetical protein
MRYCDNCDCKIEGLRTIVKSSYTNEEAYLCDSCFDMLTGLDEEPCIEDYFD